MSTPSLEEVTERDAGQDEEGEQTPRRWRRRLAAGLVLAGLGVAGWFYGPGLYARVMPTKVVDAASTIRYATATRGELKVVITESGKIRTVNSTRVYPEYQGASKITWLIPEGTSVKKGNLLATFDKKQYEDQLRTRKADLDGALRAATIADEALTIQRKSSESAVAQAKSKMDDAQVAFKVFKEMESPKKLAELDALIQEAKTKLAKEQKDLNDQQQSLDAQTTIPDEQRQILEKDLSARKESVQGLRRRTEAALLERKTYRAYTYTQTVAQKEQAAKNAGIEWEKAKVESRSQVLQKEAEVARAKDLITNLRSEIEHIEKQIAAMSVTAPIDGFVVYGDSNQSPYYYSNQRMAVGSEWYSGNVLMTLPDPSAFEASVALPETVRGWVSEGCIATRAMDAVPGLTLTGRIKKIEKVAHSGMYFEGGNNVFDSVVSIDRIDSRLITGMSARVEIVAEVFKDVLLVPIEAVTDDGGETVCYVKTPTGSERRVVKTGKSNINFVQILEGLGTGDEVDLSPSHEATRKSVKAKPATVPAGATTLPTSGPSVPDISVAAVVAMTPTTSPVPAPTTAPAAVPTPVPAATRASTQP
jgi:HlyD family secretion protein